jgi:hypothetical protein
MQRDLNLLRDDRGTATSESVILIVCILVIAIVAWQTFGETVLRLIEGD